jgi:hypothetical protein
MDLFWNKYKDCYSPRRFYKGIADIKGWKSGKLQAWMVETSTQI